MDNEESQKVVASKLQKIRNVHQVSIDPTAHHTVQQLNLANSEFVNQKERQRLKQALSNKLSFKMKLQQKTQLV
jgi:hypothetical protein